MSRSPLAYPLVRSLDTEAGGAAELQTDVMRFMAILSLCLVAIFALVQSIPPDSAPAAAGQESAKPAAEPVPVADPVTSTPLERAPQEAPDPVVEPTESMPFIEPPPSPVTMPERLPQPPVDHSPAGPPQADEGFTLRFESDNALKALVARNDIGLYALASGEAKRLRLDRGRLQFVDAPLPKAMHEMDAATVPADILQALQREDRADGVTWGVTLPQQLTRQLDRYLAGSRGGRLVIAASGNMRLE